MGLFALPSSLPKFTLPEGQGNRQYLAVEEKVRVWGKKC